MVASQTGHHARDKRNFHFDPAIFHQHDSHLVPASHAHSTHWRISRGGCSLAAFFSRRRTFMSDTRRDFLKFIVVGTMAAGCPADLSLFSAQDFPVPQLDGDHYEICHEVRDGHTFAKPPVSKRHEVVIVGGGISGLSAAYFLQTHDFLLLEKEAPWGGNATLGAQALTSFPTPLRCAKASKNSERTCLRLRQTRIRNNSTMFRSQNT